MPIHDVIMAIEKTLEDEKRVEKAAYVLKAVAHPLRIRIIQMLNENKELNVSTIYKNLNAEQSLISHHLINMRDKGILDIRRSGKNIYYFLVDTSVAEVIECIYKSKILN
jgi:DNA-binding transcriptional ArsR family regulator